MDVFMGFNPLTTGGKNHPVLWKQGPSCDPKDGFRWRQD